MLNSIEHVLNNKEILEEPNIGIICLIDLIISLRTIIRLSRKATFSNVFDYAIEAINTKVVLNNRTDRLSNFKALIPIF